MTLTKIQREAVSLYESTSSCVRTPSEQRRQEGHEAYKKGWEVRFAVATKADAAEASRLLIRAGLSPGRPYRKSPRLWILPLYGKVPVLRFLEWLEEGKRGS